MMEFFYKDSKQLTIFAKTLHHRLLAEFYIHVRHTAQRLFRTQMNIYDCGFLQKYLTAKSR